ncbi:Rne/Rng family ribonuclease [Kordiimonas sp. SCSIO 12603]|uniref:Rne/Rng family ribonuclease n=1 Tax=Kordiimonas sp. SCSIO 12603 TaxID=2829596 RepID=UPI002102D2A7|nr:Rne/Rng family ribonuclease [Kordiimonas sp. SCSIO 12603]UTW57317.1 Rne/Rng family ribonuclease [Kordiimonas sp. SCSIO 12603]
MSTRMLIDARHSEETRVTIVKGSRVEDFDYESSTRKQLKGNIYLARVTRVEPSLQAAFVEYGGNRHGFLAFSEIHPDYYQIPAEERDAIMASEAEAYEAGVAEEDERPQRGPRRRRGRRYQAEKTKDTDAVIEAEAVEDDASTTEDAENQVEEVASDDVVEDVHADSDTSDTESDTNEASDEVDTSNETDEDTSSTGETSSDDEAEEADTSSSEERRKAAVEAAKRKRGLRALKRKYNIQEVIKRRQVLLIQVVKEERGNKGAALTTYMSLAGRYCVLMPNSTHSGGISRKISNMSDRKKLKQITSSLNVPEEMGLIVRTAGMRRTKTEIKRDYDYLLRLWNGIRDLTLKSTAPALIYEEGNLIKRTIRDLYVREVDEILVEGEKGYRAAKDFMKLLMPSHAKKVQHYKDRIPLFHRYQVESHLEAMYQPVVQLKSGGYIVINPTEALISIDVNSGRATKEANIEETAVKTNLEAAEEVARQLRLRDMAGLVVIDFIDMEDRGNNRAVERRMKEVLKADRARIQVGRISSFGLMEMSRQRLRPNLLEAAMETCSACDGTGVVRSVESAALMALRQLEEEGIRNRSAIVRIAACPDVAIYLLNKKRSMLTDLEAQYGYTIEVLAQSSLGPSDIEITREAGVEGKPEVTADVVVTPESSPVVEPEEEKAETSDEEGDGQRKRRRRRRRRRGRDNGFDENQTSASEENTEGTDSVAEDTDEEKNSEKPSRRRRGSRGGRRRKSRNEEQNETDDVQTSDEGANETSEAPSDAAGSDDAEKPTRRRRRVRKKALSDENATSKDTSSDEANAEQQEVSSEKEEKPRRRRRVKKADKETSEKAEETANGETSKEVAEANDEVKPKPRRRRRVKKAETSETETAKETEKTEEAKPRRRRTTKKADADTASDKNSPAPAKETSKEKPVEAKAEVKAEAKTETVNKPVVKVESKESTSGDNATDQPKRKGWWQRTFG